MLVLDPKNAPPEHYCEYREPTTQYWATGGPVGVWGKIRFNRTWVPRIIFVSFDTSPVPRLIDGTMGAVGAQILVLDPKYAPR